MTLYVDSSAYVKRYAPDEPEHEACLELMAGDADWATSRVTLVEAPRALSLRTASDVALHSIGQFDLDAADSVLIEVDHGVVSLARAIALETGVKALDAIHVASAKRVPDPELEFLTYDDRQARAAESVGLRLARP